MNNSSLQLTHELTKVHVLARLPLFLVIFIDVMGVVLVLPVLTPLILKTSSNILPMSTSLAQRDFFYGLTLALFPFFTFLSAPILGELSDKFGRKKILLICLLMSAISYTLSAIAVFFNSIFILMFSRAIAGLCAGTQPIASAAIIDISAPDTKTTNLSWVVLIGSLGFIIGPLLGGITAEKNLIHWFGYETSFILAAILAILNAILLYCTSYPNIISIISDTTRKKNIHLYQGFLLFIYAFTNSKFRLLSVIIFFFTFAWSLYFQVINWLFMEKFNYSPGELGLFIGFIGITFVLSTLLFGLIKALFNQTTLYAFFIFSMGIANIGSALIHTEISEWLWAVLNAGSDVICMTILLNLFSDLANDKSQGWIMGVTGSISALTWTMTGLITGPLGFLNLYLPLGISGILCFFSFFLMLMYERLHITICKKSYPFDQPEY